jgi:hypothetical protein
VNAVQNGAVLASFEYHWLALREIVSNNDPLKETDREALEPAEGEIKMTPHVFKFNNPLSNTILQVSNPDLLEKYIFFTFELDIALQDRFLGELREELKL